MSDPNEKEWEIVDGIGENKAALDTIKVLSERVQKLEKANAEKDAKIKELEYFHSAYYEENKEKELIIDKFKLALYVKELEYENLRLKFMKIDEAIDKTRPTPLDLSIPFPYKFAYAKPKHGSKISIKSIYGNFIRSENGWLPISRDIEVWEKFTVEDAGNGKIALKFMGKYVCLEHGQGPMQCNREILNQCSKFDWIVNGDGTFSLRRNNGKYMRIENLIQPPNGDRESNQGCEKFIYYETK